MNHPEAGGLTTRDVLRVIQSIDAPIVGADIVEYNPSRARVKATRQARAEAGHTGGLRSGEARRKQAEEEAKADVKQTQSKEEANAKQNAKSRQRSTTGPRNKKPPKHKAPGVNSCPAP